MIGEHTFFRKIQSVLDIAQKGTATSHDVLMQEILNKNLINFLYVHFDKKSEEEVAKQSVPSIKKTINTCSDLGLITEKGTLTPAGRKAANASDFMDSLGKLVIKYLEVNDISMETVEKKYYQDVEIVSPRFAYFEGSLGGDAAIYQYGNIFFDVYVTCPLSSYYFCAE